MTMPENRLTDAEIAAVVDYIVSLNLRPDPCEVFTSPEGLPPGPGPETLGDRVAP